MKIKVTLATSVLGVFLATIGCALIPVHKMDIEQGNVITPAKVQQLRIGMSEEEVKTIFGTPLLQNTFTSDCISYVYTFQPGYGQFQEEKIILFFKGGRLKKIES